MLSLNTVYKHMSADCVPRSPKCAASMWLGCFLRMAVRPRAKESMLAEMALMATWLGPAASWMALWFLSPSDGEWGLAGAAGGGQKTDVRQKKKEKKGAQWYESCERAECMTSVWLLVKRSFYWTSLKELTVWVQRPRGARDVWDDRLLSVRLWAVCVSLCSSRWKTLVLVTIKPATIKHHQRRLQQRATWITSTQKFISVLRAQTSKNTDDTSESSRGSPNPSPTQNIFNSTTFHSLADEM